MDEGYKKLWAAVLEQAVEDARKHTGSVAMEQAHMWFRSDNVEVGSFLWICSFLDLESDSIKIHSLSAAPRPVEVKRLTTGYGLDA